MAIAALIISVVSVLVAGAAVIYTRQQATAARGTLAIEKARRYEQQRPRFEPTIKEFNSGGWYRLDLTLSTEWPLTGIEVTIAEGNGIRFGRGQTGVRPAGVDDPMLSAEWGELRPGSVACWKVDLDEERSDSILLEVTSRSEDGEQRVTPVRLKVPRFPDEYFRATRRRHGS